MKTLNNKKFLIFVIVVMLGFTTFFGTLAVQNYSKATSVENKIEKLEEKVSESKSVRLQNYKKQIADYENKKEQYNSKTEQLKSNVENVLNNFCKIMTYDATYDNLYVAEDVKKDVLSCITQQCFDEQVSKQFLFKTGVRYFVTRKLSTIFYDEFDETNPHVLALVRYRNNIASGTEFYDCTLEYDDSVKSYYISSIDVIKTSE
jgi:cell division protein FtsL